MEKHFLIIFSLTILLILSCNEAKKKKNKGNSSKNAGFNNPYASVYCDENGLSFNLTSSFETDLSVKCILPVMSNLKSLGASAIMSSTNEISSKVFHCILNLTKCLDGDTGKAIKKCVLGLKTIFVQPEKQEIYVKAQDECLQLHYDAMKSDHKTFKGYVDCILDKKHLKPLCPNKKVVSGGFSMGNFFG